MHISTEQGMEPESSILALLILGTFETELTQFNFSDSHILLGNLKWVFNVEAWSAAYEPRASWGIHQPGCFNRKTPRHAKPRIWGGKVTMPCAPLLQPGANYPVNSVGMELTPNYLRSYRQISSVKKKHCSGSEISTQMLGKARFVVPAQL